MKYYTNEKDQVTAIALIFKRFAEENNIDVEQAAEYLVVENRMTVHPLSEFSTDSPGFCSGSVERLNYVLDCGERDNSNIRYYVS